MNCWYWTFSSSMSVSFNIKHEQGSLGPELDKDVRPFKPPIGGACIDSLPLTMCCCPVACP